jgi:putative transposase
LGASAVCAIRAFLFGLLLSVAIAGSAAAADLSASLPIKQPVPYLASSYDWSGWYVGAHVGVICGSSNWSSTIGRLKDGWSEEHVRWSRRDLSAKRYVYFWADGIHVQARLEDDAQCLLVIIGATAEGKKELVGLIDGVRESAQSWRELLLDLKRRGLSIAPELAVADGALGFWQAIEEVWPKTRGQRCWVHKTANVLNKLPKSQHSKAKRALQEIWMAETKKDALAAFDVFVETWGVKYEKAVECLVKDRDALLAFYDFPAEHWKHLRTTNVIESAFATVRHRTVRAKGCLSNKTALAMIFKLAEAAERSWRRLDGHNQLPKIILGVRFADGIEVVRSQAQAAAA